MLESDEITTLIRSMAIIGASTATLLGLLSDDGFVVAAAVILGTVVSMVNVLWLKTLVAVILFPDERTTRSIVLAVVKPIATIVVLATILVLYRGIVPPLLVGFFTFMPAVLVIGFFQARGLGSGDYEEEETDDLP